MTKEDNNFLKWAQTRQYHDDLSAATGDDSIPLNTGGYTYEPGYIEEDGGAGYIVTVSNESQSFADHVAAERFLWDRFAKDTGRSGGA